ncbi:hypothetical protein GCM10010330_80010 [Streptomyces tendae]|nr:hypothetical protein GCM10010330_80010 [Streptomyces tendae]
MTTMTIGFTTGFVAQDRGGVVRHAGAAAEPIFDELARCWEAFGRMVPGRPDPEWDHLVGPWARSRSVIAQDGAPPEG